MPVEEGEPWARGWAGAGQAPACPRQQGISRGLTASAWPAPECFLLPASVPLAVLSPEGLSTWLPT